MNKGFYSILVKKQALTRLYLFPQLTNNQQSKNARLAHLKGVKHGNRH